MFRLHKNEFINLCCACCTLILGTPFDLTEPDFIDFFIIHFHFATCDSLVFIMFITAQIFFFFQALCFNDAEIASSQDSPWRS